MSGRAHDGEPSDGEVDAAREALAARLRALEEDAFAEVVARTSAPLLRLAMSMTSSLARSEELVQQCHVIAYEALLDRKWDGHYPMAWCRTVLMRLAIGQAKRDRRRRVILQTIGWKTKSDPDEVLRENQSLPAHLVEHLDALPTLQRAALMMQALEMASVKEIADTLHKSEGAIEQLLVRARKTLRERLHDAR